MLLAFNLFTGCFPYPDSLGDGKIFLSASLLGGTKKRLFSNVPSLDEWAWWGRLVEGDSFSSEWWHELTVSRQLPTTWCVKNWCVSDMFKVTLIKAHKESRTHLQGDHYGTPSIRQVIPNITTQDPWALVCTFYLDLEDSWRHWTAGQNFTQ